MDTRTNTFKAGSDVKASIFSDSAKIKFPNLSISAVMNLVKVYNVTAREAFEVNQFANKNGLQRI
jgi:hypothetical protein